MPFPPAATTARLVRADIAGCAFTVVRHLTQHGFRLRHEAGGPVLFPPAFQPRAVAVEPQPPMRPERHRDHRRIVGPMFEHAPIPRMQPVQRRRTITSPARPQNHVMGAGKGVYAVHLHEPQIVDHSVQPGRTRPRTQTVPVQKHPPRGGIGQHRYTHRARSSAFFWSSRISRNESINSAVTNPMFSNPFVAASPDNNRHSCGNSTSPNPSVVKTTSAK